MIRPYADYFPNFKKHEDDKAFLKWLRTLPSCLDGNEPCEACHVRRVSQGAGMGIKPAFFAVPMTHAQHGYQHQYGELSVILKYRPDLDFQTGTAAKEWFAEQAMKYRDMWIAKNHS